LTHALARFEPDQILGLVVGLLRREALWLWAFNDDEGKPRLLVTLTPHAAKRLGACLVETGSLQVPRWDWPGSPEREGPTARRKRKRRKGAVVVRSLWSRRGWQLVKPEEVAARPERDEPYLDQVSGEPLKLLGVVVTKDRGRPKQRRRK
jgi:hypothetical protein